MTNLFAISNGGIAGIIIGSAAALLIIIIVIAIIKIRNNFVVLRNNVDESWSTIDIYLKKRYDLIPNLVETVKGYAKHESGTLESVIAARSKAMGSQGQEKIDAENQLSQGLRKIFVLSESYPQLKADGQFINLQNQLSRIESELASSRTAYNSTVKVYNTKIDLFPSNIVARSMRLEKRQFFETPKEERENVRVKF